MYLHISVSCYTLCRNLNSQVTAGWEKFRQLFCRFSTVYGNISKSIYDKILWLFAKGLANIFDIDQILEQICVFQQRFLTEILFLPIFLFNPKFIFLRTFCVLSKTCDFIAIAIAIASKAVLNKKIEFFVLF